jgi:hypothetical protein
MLDSVARFDLASAIINRGDAENAESAGAIQNTPGLLNLFAKSE